MSQEKRTLLGMLAGTAGFGILACLVCILLLSHPLPWAAGIAAGCMTAVLLGIHMYWGLNRTLWLEEKSAKAYARRLSAFRMFIMMAVLAVSGIFTQYVNVLGTLIGLFGLKAGAYVQPFIDKILFKNKQ